jgi:hypothetical protein
MRPTQVFQERKVFEPSATPFRQKSRSLCGISERCGRPRSWTVSQSFFFQSLAVTHELCYRDDK